MATPLPARDGRPWSEHDGRRLSVSAWADGPDGWSTTPLGPGHWSALGRALRAAHDLTVDAGLAETLPRETYDPSRWVERCGEVDAGLGVPAGPSGCGDDDLLVTVRRSWAGARGRIMSARDVVTDVGRRLRSRSHWPVDVVCHGDAHGGNLILRGDGRVVLLDWDDTVLAPVERDLMFVRSPRIWYATPAYGEHHAAFAAGYGAPADPDPEVLTYYRCLRALEDVVDLVTWVLDPGRTRAERAAAVGYVADVIAPGGHLDVALGAA